MNVVQLAMADDTAVMRDKVRSAMACMPNKSRRQEKQVRLSPCADSTEKRNQLRRKLLARRPVLLREDGTWGERAVVNVAHTVEALASCQARLVQQGVTCAVVLEHPKRGTMVYAASVPVGREPHAAWPYLTPTQRQTWQRLTHPGRTG